MDVASGKIFRIRSCFLKKSIFEIVHEEKKDYPRICILLFVLYNYKNFIYGLIFVKKIFPWMFHPAKYST